MSILLKHIPFVKEQAAFHAKMAEQHVANNFRANLHKQTADKFNVLTADIEAMDALLDAPAPTKKQPGAIHLSLTMEDVKGLPQELVEELSLSEADKTEFEIINAIEEAGGIISLDKLLIALFHHTQEIHKRAAITSRLARMAQKNAIYYVPGKKGAYSTEQLSNEDVAKLFGVAKQTE